MHVPIIAGKPINLWLGLVLIVLLIFQILSGKQWIKVPFDYHRKNAWLIAIVAAFHVYWGLGIWFFRFKIR